MTENLMEEWRKRVDELKTRDGYGDLINQRGMSTEMLHPWDFTDPYADRRDTSVKLRISEAQEAYNSGKFRLFENLLRQYSASVTKWSWATGLVNDPRLLYQETRSFFNFNLKQGLPKFKLLNQAPKKTDEKFYLGFDDKNRVVVAKTKDGFLPTLGVSLFDYSEPIGTIIEFSFDFSPPSHPRLMALNFSDGRLIECVSEIEQFKYRYGVDNLLQHLQIRRQFPGVPAESFELAAEHDDAGLRRLFYIQDQSSQHHLLYERKAESAKDESAILELDKYVVELKSFILYEIERFRQTNPETEVSCVAVWGEPYHGWVKISIDTPQRFGVVSGYELQELETNYYSDTPEEFEYNDWAFKGFPEWEEFCCSPVSKKMIQVSGKAPQKVSTENVSFSKPFFTMMCDLLKELEKENQLPKFTRAKICYLQVQISDGEPYKAWRI